MCFRLSIVSFSSFARLCTCALDLVVIQPKAPACKPAKAKDETADLIKKLIGVLQGTQANNPKAKAKVQEWDPDSDDEESDESEEE